MRMLKAYATSRCKEAMLLVPVCLLSEVSPTSPSSSKVCRPATLLSDKAGPVRAFPNGPRAACQASWQAVGQPLRQNVPAEEMLFVCRSKWHCTLCNRTLIHIA